MPQTHPGVKEKFASGVGGKLRAKTRIFPVYFRENAFFCGIIL